MSKKSQKTSIELKDSLVEKNQAIQKVFDLAASETRELTADEKYLFEKLQTEIKTIESDLEKIEKEENKPIRVQFLKSPTGIYNLGYSAGDKIKVKAVLANKMIVDKTAKKIK